MTKYNEVSDRRTKKLIHGNSLEKLKELEDNSVDAVICDPPYELGFMGKKWDNTGIAYNIDLWAECLRVLKPGGHLLAFSGTRTYHRMAVAIEDAGFEVRDMIEWVYGSGFPKSLNIGKAVDKLQGNEREIVGISQGKGYSSQQEKNKAEGFRPYEKGLPYEHADRTLTKGTSEWEGWGTALKPAHEPICMARKPITEKNLAQNVLKWGTGGINVDECRVGVREKEQFTGKKEGSINAYGDYYYDKSKIPLPKGRFPANLIHDGSDEVVSLFPDTGKSTGGRIGNKGSSLNMTGNNYEKGDPGFGDSGSAARFFYCAKASKSERNKGCEYVITNENGQERVGNIHSTVKPISLMRYLVRLVTPKGGTVLDPFMGSGTTGIGAKLEGFDFIGIEREEEYIKIAEARINAWEEDNKLL